jgi:hypothetical protein
MIGNSQVEVGGEKYMLFVVSQKVRMFQILLNSMRIPIQTVFNRVKIC